MELGNRLEDEIRIEEIRGDKGAEEQRNIRACPKTGSISAGLSFSLTSVEKVPAL